MLLTTAIIVSALLARSTGYANPQSAALTETYCNQFFSCAATSEDCATSWCQGDVATSMACYALVGFAEFASCCQGSGDASQCFCETLGAQSGASVDCSLAGSGGASSGASGRNGAEGVFRSMGEVRLDILAMGVIVAGAAMVV